MNNDSFTKLLDRPSRRRSNYRVVAEKDGVVWLIDVDDGAISVTNDAETVVQELAAAFPGRRFYYRDSDGCWGELQHSDGVFTGFGDGVEPPL